MQQLFALKAVDVSRSDHHFQKSPRRSRLLALPFVALCTVVYLSSAAHFAVVQHATCLEHGEAVHLGEEGVAAQPQRLASSFADEGVTWSSQEDWIGHGAEAHCAHTFMRRESILPTYGCLLMPADVTESVRILGWEQLPSEPVARLRLAPKSSPPLS